MPVSKLAVALVACGIDAEELIEALEAAAEEGSKGGKGGKGGKDTKAGKDAKGGKDAKAGKGKGKGKGEPDLEEILEDLEDDQVVELLIDLELTTKAKAKKLERDDLIELLQTAIDDEEIELEEVEETIQELFEGSGDEAYEDMEEDDLRALVVERKVMTKAAAKKADKDDMIDALEEADEE